MLEFLIGGLGGLVTASAMQAAAVLADRRRCPPPGRLVDVGGLRLHAQITGTGSPTVVLDSGTGGSLVEWFRVVPDLSKFARVVTYDRAGFGWSDPPRQAPTSLHNAELLHRLLENLEIPGPYVLVGRAIGGLNLRIFAARYPRQTAGLVLLDVTHENEPERILPELKRSGRRDLRLAAVAARLAPFGFVRLAGSLGLLPKVRVLEHCPPSIQAQATAAIYRSGYPEAVWREFAIFPQTAAQVRAMPFPAEIPLAVLTAGMHLDPRDFPLDFPIDRAQKIWEQLQAELTFLSHTSSHRVIPGCGHYLALERPDLVVEAIREIVRQAQH